MAFNAFGNNLASNATTFSMCTGDDPTLVSSACATTNTITIPKNQVIGAPQAQGACPSGRIKTLIRYNPPQIQPTPGCNQ